MRLAPVINHVFTPASQASIVAIDAAASMARIDSQQRTDTVRGDGLSAVPGHRRAGFQADNIGDTVNVYLAFRAALLAVIAHNDESTTSIKSLRDPALGTGIGSMPLARSADQMHAAFSQVASPKAAAREHLLGVRKSDT
jgi:hypothetical protein